MDKCRDTGKYQRQRASPEQTLDPTQTYRRKRDDQSTDTEESSELSASRSLEYQQRLDHTNGLEVHQLQHDIDRFQQLLEEIGLESRETGKIEIKDWLSVERRGQGDKETVEKQNRSAALRERNEAYRLENTAALQKHRDKRRDGKQQTLGDAQGRERQNSFRGSDEHQKNVVTKGEKSRIKSSRGEDSTKSHKVFWTSSQ
jgi:hypothetical protein